MKVICNRGALLEAISVTQQVVNPRSPRPVLTCLRLTAEDGRLTLSATDLEVAVRYSDTQVDIQTPGETLVPADKLRDIVRESVDDTLSLELADNQMHIKGQDSHFRIYTQNPADFPPVRGFEGEADLKVPGGLLRKLINQTLFAAAKEGTRFAFNGVLVILSGKELSLVSSDGRRLAKAHGELSEPVAGEGERTSIVPAKTLGLVDKLINDPEQPVSVQLHENQVVFHNESATLTSNLVEGQFPPYQDVIPRDADKKMTAGTADLLSAVRRAALLTTEESKGVRMTFDEGGLKLVSRSPDAGEAEVNFACKFEGEPMEIGFNPQFLTDALRVVDTDEVTFEVSAPNRPGLLKGGDDFLYVIMPVSLT